MGTVTIERPRPVPRPVVKRSAAELSAIDVLPTSEATILVVDHHRSFADVLAQALKRGCRDAMRGHGVDRIGRNRVPGQFQPDIVVLDVQMRGQDGLVAIRRIREAASPEHGGRCRHREPQTRVELPGSAGGRVRLHP